MTSTPGSREAASGQHDAFSSALRRHAIELPLETSRQLDRYAQSLWAANRRLNLTRHTTYDKFVARDLVDSLALAKLLTTGEIVLDLGTGGGVPGIVLAILRPDLHVALAESVAKKARAVGGIVDELNLDVRLHHARGEEVLHEMRFDTVVARAVAPLYKLLGWLKPHWQCCGRLLVIKGPSWIQERHAARERNLLDRLQLRRVDQYAIPHTGAETVILEIRPRAKSR